MTSQSKIPPVADVLGTIGTVFWCVQLIPQIWHNWRRKDTNGLPASMMLLWAVCSVPFGAYDTILSFALPLIIQPQVFGTLAIIVWAQCMYYNSGWSCLRTCLISLALWAACGGIEALLILTLRPVYSRGVQWPLTILGVVAAVLLVVGFVPAWLEIIRRRGRVVGMNFVFLTVDWMGAFFSLMGVVTQGQFDVLGGVLYIGCAAIELCIFVSQGIWLVRTHKLRKQARHMGVEFDDLPEARKYQWPRYTDDEERQSSPREQEATTPAHGQAGVDSFGAEECAERKS